MKGYDYLKKALDGDIEYKTIIRAKHLYEDGYDFDYYIYEKDRMFHRCNSEGKLGMKYQDRFLNYKVLEKDFGFYCVLEEKKKIPEKLKIEQDGHTYNNFYIVNQNGTKCYLTKHSKMIAETVNQVIDYLKSKGE